MKYSLEDYFVATFEDYIGNYHHQRLLSFSFGVVDRWRDHRRDESSTKHVAIIDGRSAQRTIRGHLKVAIIAGRSAQESI